MSKRPSDLDQVPGLVVEEPNVEIPEVKHEKTKNPAAVALGRLGGLKGGRARAKILSSDTRSEIAKKAAVTRWKKTPH